MRRFLISTIAAMIGLSFCGVVLAAEGPTSQPVRKHHCALMCKTLNLTDAQKAQIKEIFTTARADAQKATDKDAKRAIWKAAVEKVKTTVLTDEQRQKLAQMHHRHMMFAKLNLTDAQKAQVKDILTAARADASKATDPAAKKAIFKAAFDKIKTDVLTDAQRQQLEQMKAKHEAGATAPAASAVTK